MSEEEQQRVHYIHRLSYTVQERIVGAFVLAALAVIFLLLFINSKTAHLFEDYVTFHAYLDNAVGISTDTPVKISGIDVGRVKSLDISPDNRIHLELIVFERYRSLVRADSKASLGKLSVIGRSMVMIVAGSPDSPLLPDNATLQVEEPMSVDELVAELTPVVKAIEVSVERFAALITQIQPEQMQSIVSNLQQSSENIRQISGQIQSGKGFLGMAVHDEKFRTDFASAITAIDKAFTLAEARLAQLEPTLENTGKASGEFPQIAKEFRELLANANTTLTSVNVEMRELPELISRMKVLMERTDRLLEGISNSWLFSSEEERQRGKLIGVQPPHE